MHAHTYTHTHAISLPSPFFIFPLSPFYLSLPSPLFIYLSPLRYLSLSLPFLSFSPLSSFYLSLSSPFCHLLCSALLDQYILLILQLFDVFRLYILEADTRDLLPVSDGLIHRVLDGRVKLKSIYNKHTKILTKS